MKEKWKIPTGVLIFMLIIIVNLGGLSAWDFDNVKKYDQESEKVTIKSSVLKIPFSDLWTEAEVTLLSPRKNLVLEGEDRMVAEFEINVYDDEYVNALKKTDFYNYDSMDRHEREFTYKYAVDTEKEVDDYKTICNQNTLVNGSNYETCSQVKNGTKTIIETEWITLETNNLPKGKNRIGIFTDVINGEHTELIPTWFGLELEEFVDFVGYTRYEWKTTDDDDNNAIGDNTNLAMNFTVGTVGTNEDFTLKGVAIKIFTQNNPTILNVSVWTSNSNGKLDTLISNNGTFDSTGASGSDPGDWINITLPDATINASTTYILLLSHAYADGNYVRWRKDTTPDYAGGRQQSYDDSLTYVGEEDSDMMFQIFGSAIDYNPNVTILFPEKGSSYISNPGEINYSVSALINDPDRCWYSTDFGTTNSTPTVTAGTNFTGLSASQGSNTWTVYCNNTIGVSNDTSTFTLDSLAPVINITSPNGTVNYQLSGTNISLNWSIVEVNLDSCWYEYDGVNYTIDSETCSASNVTSFNVTDPTITTLIFFANDSSSTVSEAQTNWTYTVFENSRNFNATTYETLSEGYIVNVTSSSSLTSKLYYNNTSYSMTKSGTTGEQIFSYSRALPTISSQVINPFYFEFTSGSTKINSTLSNQTVSNMTYSICNPLISNATYVNFTFKDEGDLSLLNASIPSSSWVYYMTGGDATTNKTYLYSNSTESPSYGFCFAPQDRGVTTTAQIKYENSNYPIRTFSFTSEALTNATTNQVLYLLSSTDGIYSSIQTVNTIGAPISGVQITVERMIGGVWVVIGQENTDDSGLATFWVNPNFQHRYTAVKSGYSSITTTITPSQSLYTITMSETGDGDAAYNNTIVGLKWEVHPGIGTISPGSHNFNLTVTSTEENLQNCKYELLNATNITDIFASNTGFTNSSYCFVSITYTTLNDTTFFGRISVDTTSTDGFVIVDSDIKYTVFNRVGEDWRGITGFFSELKDIGEFGEGNKGTFSRLIVFFFIVTLLIGLFTYFSGVEISSPGLSILLVWGIVFLASIGGFLTFNMENTNFENWEILQQYGFFFILTTLLIGYFIDSIRRDIQ